MPSVDELFPASPVGSARFGSASMTPPIRSRGVDMPRVLPEPLLLPQLLA